MARSRLDLARVIRQSAHHLLPIVLLVGRALKPFAIDDRSRPVDAVLQKTTIDMTTLLHTVTGLLQGDSRRPLLP